MITATDPRLVRLADAWGSDPDTLLREVLEVQSSAAGRGYAYEVDDLVNAALATQNLVDALVSALE